MGLTPESHAEAVKDALAHYSNMRNDRVKTVLTLQSILFAAIGLMWDKSPSARLVLAAVGILASIALVGFLRDCDRMAREVLAWWEKTEGKTWSGFPPKLMYEVSDSNMRGLFKWTGLLELVLGAGWGAIVIIALKEYLK